MTELSEWTDYVYKSLWSDGMGELDFMPNYKNKKTLKQKFKEILGVKR